MPSIRIPRSAEPLLPLCRKHEEPWDNACFDTYADLIIFAASFGFQSLAGRKPDEPQAYLKHPNPIDLAVFKNQQLFPSILLMALAAEGDSGIVRDEEDMCRLVEGYVCVGCKCLASVAGSRTSASLHLELSGSLKQRSFECLPELI